MASACGFMGRYGGSGMILSGLRHRDSLRAARSHNDSTPRAKRESPGYGLRASGRGVREFADQPDRDAERDQDDLLHGGVDLGARQMSAAMRPVVLSRR